MMSNTRNDLCKSCRFRHPGLYIKSIANCFHILNYLPWLWDTLKKMTSGIIRESKRLSSELNSASKKIILEVVYF